MLGPEDTDRLRFWGLLPVEGLLKGLEDRRPLAEQLLPLRRPGGGLRPALGGRGATILGHFRPITGWEAAYRWRNSWSNSATAWPVNLERMFRWTCPLSHVKLWGGERGRVGMGHGGHRGLPQGWGAAAGLEGGDPALCPPVLPRVILRKPWRDSVPLSPKAELELPVQPMSAGRLASEEVARVTFWPQVRVPPAAQVMAP